ncbi:Ldh family oxidoreductase [Dasania marina]|uniref:Ldh family oxidoreductase n=1 Tax=Dasania marina TaxID=471499 RepID=UPI0030D8D692|tara:strand:- start:71602 stop:72648 length:1047 start_codon:yes stop_codon:yes gene_type:complete
MAGSRLNQQLLHYKQLQQFVSQVLLAVSTPEDIADYLALALINSNLRGADSHGILQLPAYIEDAEQGDIDVAARASLSQDSGAMASLNGNRGFGIFALKQAGELAIQRAQQYGCATINLRNCSHTGRLGEVAEQLAERGFYVQIMGGGGRYKWPGVVPFGGVEPVFSTNPYAYAMPAGKAGPVVIDFATSAVSEGKVSAYLAAGKSLEPGSILDSRGQPSTNPHDYFNGGALLPAAGHKGYGLALIAELMGDAALHYEPEMNWMLHAIDLKQLRDQQQYSETADALLTQITNSTPADGNQAVLIPGQRGRKIAEHRREAGIPIPADLMRRLNELREKCQLPPELLQAS